MSNDPVDSILCIHPHFDAPSLLIKSMPQACQSPSAKGGTNKGRDAPIPWLFGRCGGVVTHDRWISIQARGPAQHPLPQSVGPKLQWQCSPAEKDEVARAVGGCDTINAVHNPMATPHDQITGQLRHEWHQRTQPCDRPCVIHNGLIPTGSPNHGPFSCLVQSGPKPHFDATILPCWDGVLQSSSTAFVGANGGSLS